MRLGRPGGWSRGVGREGEGRGSAWRRFSGDGCAIPASGRGFVAATRKFSPVDVEEPASPAHRERAKFKMPPPVLIDVTKLDQNKIVRSHADIYRVIPQRHEFELLTAIIYEDPEVVVGYKEVTENEFWVRGHIPGRPLMPGVLMIECAAQLCAYRTMILAPEMGFVGFAKCDETRFRGTVVPPSRLIMAVKLVELNRRRAVAQAQGFCKGTLVFESIITGMSV
jgi:3-hydroxyacyl-[acyl-carrier-protein] dehydratase